MARLSILSKKEINSLYGIPQLCDDERSFLFSLDEFDQDYLQTLGNNTNRKINYILQLGYYQAINYFFRFSFEQRREDTEFILKHHFSDAPFPKKQLSKRHHYINRSVVMKKYGIKDVDLAFTTKLTKMAKSFARRHVLPRLILQEILSYCSHNNVIRPSYSTLQDLVSMALKNEENRLRNKLYTAINHQMRQRLDNLLDNDDLFYHLTLLKKDQKTLL